MPKAHLTQAFVANAGCEVGKKKTDWYDTHIPGFILERRVSGKGTYYLRYNDVSGRQRQHKIGGVDDVTCAAARKKAQELRSEVVMGGDPGAKKALAKSIPLYGELAAKHLAFAKLHLKSYDDLESCMRVHIVPKWGKTRLTDMTSQSVGQWLNEKRISGLAPASVEKLRVILGRSFVLGASWDIPGTERNPTRGIPRKPLNNSRERFLTPEETVRLKAAVAASQNPQLQHIVGLLLAAPIALAFDAADNLYVANSGNHTVSKVSPAGAVSTFATGFIDPDGLAFDAAGNLYVANSGDNTVRKVPSSGGTSTTAATGFSTPFGLAFDAAGNLYVANNGNNTVSKVTPPATPAPAPIPTMTEWTMILLSVLLAGGAVLVMQRRRQVA